MARITWFLLHIRKMIWITSFFWIALVLSFLVATVPPSSSRYIQLSRIFADTAGIYLYLTLLIGPLTYWTKSNLWSAVALKARQSVGICVLLFGLLHSGTAFLFQLGGIAGLQFLSTRYLFALALGLNAALLLVLLTATSPNRVVLWLGRSMWKVIHRLVYLVGVLVLFHMVLLGSRFADLHGWVAVLSYLAVSFLCLLECNRADVWLGNLQPKLRQWHLVEVAGSILVLATGWYMIHNPVNPYSLSGHDGHYEYENVVGTQGTHHTE